MTALKKTSFFPLKIVGYLILPLACSFLFSTLLQYIQEMRFSTYDGFYYFLGLVVTLAMIVGLIFLTAWLCRMLQFEKLYWVYSIAFPIVAFLYLWIRVFAQIGRIPSDQEYLFLCITVGIYLLGLYKKPIR